jgi:hypothetical protein
LFPFYSLLLIMLIVKPPTISQTKNCNTIDDYLSYKNDNNYLKGEKIKGLMGVGSGKRVTKQTSLASCHGRDVHQGLKAALRATFNDVPWTRCHEHLQRNAGHYVPRVHLRAEVPQGIRSS